MAARRLNTKDVLRLLKSDNQIEDVKIEEACFQGSDDEVSDFERLFFLYLNLHNN